MRNSFKTFLLVAALTLSAARHPFVGKNKDLDSIVRDDGSVAVKMNAKKRPFDRYDKFINRRTSYTPELSLQEKTIEMIYGKSLEKLDFEDSVDRYLSKHKTSTSEGKRLGDGHIVAVLDQTAYVWTAAIYMGRFTPMNVLFDTASDWLVIEDVNCRNCEGNKYDARQGEKISEDLVERAYGTTFFKGYVYSDTACIQLSACVRDFEYFAIQEQVGLSEPVDGILGLARGLDTFQLEGNATVNTTTNYVTAMREQGLIDVETFSFYFNNLESSYVDFGQYQETSTAGEIKYIQTLEDYFWSVETLAVGFGKSPDDKPRKFKEPVYSIIDTSYPTIAIANEYFDTYIDAIFSKTKGRNYQVEQGQVLVQCDYKFPNLYFMIGDYWFEVRPEEYVLDVSEDNDGSLCIFAISQNTESFNILGGPVLQDYYSIFNLEDGTIGVAPHTVSQKGVLEEATLPKKKLSSSKNVVIARAVTWVIVFLFAGGLGCVWYFVFYPWLQDQFENNALAVVGISTAYFFVMVLFLVYVIRPLFISVMAVSPTHGGLATPENYKLENVGTMIYLAVAGWIYVRILKSFKPKALTKQKSSSVEGNSEQINKLLDILKEASPTQVA